MIAHTDDRFVIMIIAVAPVVVFAVPLRAALVAIFARVPHMT